MSDSSFSLTTFSANGKLVQIEYALAAVSAGKSSLGIKAADGVVILTEKKLPSILIDEKSVEKISVISPNVGVTYSGMGPDFRLLVRRSRKCAQKYMLDYNDAIPMSMNELLCWIVNQGQLVREIGAVMQEFTQSGGVRPFGVSLLVAGFDDEGPQLYQVDPSGAFFPWKASAIGKFSTQCKDFLEKRYNPEMELDDAIHTAILTMKEGFEGAMNENNIEIGVVGKDRQFRILTSNEVKDYLNEVE